MLSPGILYSILLQACASISLIDEEKPPSAIYRSQENGRPVMVDRKPRSIESMYMCCAIFCLAVMVSHCSGTLPPDPNNAALLYYQAFLLCPEPDAATRRTLDRASYANAEVDTRVREYVERCRGAIHYTGKASRISNCDWGTWFSLGLGFHVPQLNAVRLLSRVLHMDARILAAEGDYRGAFERCLTMRRLANHVGGQTVHFYALAMGTEYDAQRCILQILGMTSPDIESIKWLRDQLMHVSPPSPSPAMALRMDMELTLQSLRTGEKWRADVRRRLEEADSEDARHALSLSDEELLSYVQEPYMEFMDSALFILGSTMVYEDAYAAIQVLVRNLDEKVNGDPVGKIVAKNLAMLTRIVPQYYTNQVLTATRLNIFSIALDLYLEKARTGQLPAKPSRDWPKDVYSGQEFVYIVTENTFLLRSRVQPADGRNPIEVECRIPQDQGN